MTAIAAERCVGLVLVLAALGWAAVVLLWGARRGDRP